MHVRTRLRHAVRDRLIAAGVAGGSVHVHPRSIDENAIRYVVIEPEMETGIEVKGPYGFRPRQGDNKLVGRLQVRPIRFSVTVYAKDEGQRDADGNIVVLEKDADEVADDTSADIEGALFDGNNRLMTKDEVGNPVRLGERDLKLLGTGGVRDPSTGTRLIGCVHMLFEALMLTDEGDPSNTINR